MDDFVRINSPGPEPEDVLVPQPSSENSSDRLDFLNAHPFVHQSVLDKIYGCMIGSALGDTIGLYTEFLTKAQSAQVYPQPKFQLIEPATEFHPDSHRCKLS